MITEQDDIERQERLENEKTVKKNLRNLGLSATTQDRTQDAEVDLTNRMVVTKLTPSANLSDCQAKINEILDILNKDLR